MSERLEDIKQTVNAMSGDLKAIVFGVEMNADAVVSDFKWLIEQAEKAERRKILIDTVHGLATRDGYENIKNYLEQFND